MLKKMPKIQLSENTQKIVFWGSIALLIGITVIVVKSKKDKKARLENESQAVQKEYEGLLNRIDKAPK
jgi:cytochrome c-type biogenesis protein CcmH/NrfF